MEIIKSVDTEKEITPTTPGAGEAGNKPTEETEFEKQFRETKEKLEEKTMQNLQLTDALQKERSKNKTPLITEQPKQPTPAKPDDGFDGEDDFDIKYQARRAEEKKADYISRVNRCFDRFSKKDGVEFDGETDLQFRKLANSMNLGDSDDEVMEKFQVLYNGLKPKKSVEEKPVINLGDGGSEEPIKPKKGKDEWANKKLNKYEQEAAQHFPGGESAYRKKMQTLADSRQD